jgi:fucose 4-O-acetylase-like acetyltransferase
VAELVKKERLKHIDIARGMGIFLVILAHISLPSVFINLVYFFHMPLFFYLSGIFYKKRPWKEELQRAAWMWGSILFYGIGFILIAALTLGRGELSKITELLLLTPQGTWSIPYFGVFWFLVALLVIRLLANILPPSVAIGVILFFVTYFVNSKTGAALAVLPFCIGPALLCYVFYRAGSLNTKIESLYAGWRLALIFLAYLVAAAGFILIFGGTQRKIVNYHQMMLFNPMAALLLACLGIPCTIWLSLFIARHFPSGTLAKALAFWGDNSFHLLVWHLFAFQMFLLFFNHSPLPASGAVLRIGQLGTAFLFAYISVRIQRRYAASMPPAVSRLLYLR